MVAAAITTVVLVALSFGLWGTVYMLALVSMMIPRRFTDYSATPNTGLTSASPELWSYGLIIFGAAALLVAKGKNPVPRPFWPFMAVMVVLTAFVWPQDSSYVRAGLLHLTGAILAFGVGGLVAKESTGNPKTSSFILRITILLIALELAVSVAQFVGVAINPMDPNTAALMGTRVNGTLNHPNNLGKVLLLLIIVLTFFWQSADIRNRRLAVLGMFLAAVPLALTGGRAVLLAGLSVVVLSSLLNADKSSRWKTLLGFVALIAPFGASTYERFLEDPEGGSRPYLTDLAWREIASSPWAGMGPNLYVQEVGKYDSLTAGGLPVHNGFLLVLAEMGLIGCAALFIPFAVLLVRAWRKRAACHGQGAAARTYLASLPAIVLVVGTGWGMLSGPYMYMWFLVIGFLYGHLTVGACHRPIGTLPVKTHRLEHFDRQLGTSRLEL